MSLRKRILYLTILGLSVIFIVYALFIYFFFVKITTDAEVRLLWNRAQIVLRNEEVRVPSNWTNPELLREFLIEHSSVRIIGPDGRVRSAASNDPSLSQFSPVYRTAYHTAIESQGGERKIYIDVPIKLDGRQVGMLELGKSMYVMRDYLGVLITILTSSTLFGLLFSVVVGIGYTRFIFRPMERLIGTMERIETSGTFRRLDQRDLPQSEEFSRLGTMFNRMMASLEENYNQQKKFIEDASHELRTPLTVIESYAGMLSRWGGNDPALREEAVEAIRQEAARLQALVTQLLQLAQGEHVQAPFEDVDLLQVVRKTAKELSKAFHRKVEVVEEKPAEEVRLFGDPARIKQLLIILLDNALKYSNRNVTVKVREMEDTVSITVTDQGIGISKEHVRRLFDRFYRVERDRNRSTGGSGLGLAIAKRIVTEHRGRITVESTPGKGTDIIVVLPQKEKAAPKDDLL